MFYLQIGGFIVQFLVAKTKHSLLSEQVLIVDDKQQHWNGHPLHLYQNLVLGVFVNSNAPDGECTVQHQCLISL